MISLRVEEFKFKFFVGAPRVGLYVRPEARRPEARRRAVQCARGAHVSQAGSGLVGAFTGPTLDSTYTLAT